jgi:hypothetical protein
MHLSCLNAAKEVQKMSVQAGMTAIAGLSGMPGGIRNAAVSFTLVDDLRENDYLSPAKFIEVMNLDLNTFAQHARVHRNTVTRAPATASVQSHIRDNLRVLRAAWDVRGGDMNRAKVWFRNEPLPEFGYKTAEALVAEGRADDVIRLIESYSAGATG